jgi:tRNA-Thr(GGU) m(6)t(6)A37 methyltransferase TsaA
MNTRADQPAFGAKPTRGIGLSPIGRVRTTWAAGNCPKNMAAARATGHSATLMIDPPWRAGLTGLERASHLILLGWFDGADQDVLLQRPAHLPREQGCFALRTPARPNPIGVSIVRRLSLGLADGLTTIEALDWFDGTAIIDIKPYFASTDAYPDAQVQDLQEL